MNGRPVPSECVSCQSLDTATPLYVYATVCTKVMSRIATIGCDARREGNRCELFAEGFGRVDYQFDKRVKVSRCMLSFTFPLAAAHRQL